MRKTVSRLLAMLLAAVMVIGAVGCQSNGGNGGNNTSTATNSGSGNTSTTETSKSTSTQEESTVAAPVELEICMGQTRWGADDLDPTHMEAYAKAIGEATNTIIKINAPTHTDFNDKLAAIMNSGKYPDVIRPQQAWDTVGVYAGAGKLQALTKYVKEDSRIAPFVADFDLGIYSSGTDVYGIPTNAGNCKIFWFRQDMVDKYGLKISDTMTTDQFVTEMQKVNQSEAIPLCIPKWVVNFQIYYNFFGAYAGIIKDANGKWYDGVQTQEMKDALTWLKQIYDLGIVDKEWITNQNADMRDKFYSGRAVAMVDYSTYYNNIKNNSASAEKPTVGVPVYTLVGPNGGKGNVNESGNEAFCVTTQCQNPDAAIDVISWLMFTEEGQLTAIFGVEGVHYTVENGVLTPKEDAVAGGYALSPISLGSSFVKFDLNNLPFSFSTVSSEDLATAATIVATSLKSDYLGPMIKVPVGASEIYDQVASNYNDAIYELATSVMIGTKPLDQAFADYEMYFKSIQGDEMLAQLNK